MEDAALSVGGRKLVYFPPAFSEDGAKLLICTGNSVSVYSPSTGLLVTELEGHSALVTSVIVVPMGFPAMKFSSFCWTSSLDGTIGYWDFSTPELIKRVEVSLPIFYMVIPSLLSSESAMQKKPSDPFALVSVRDTSKPNDEKKALGWQIRVFSLNKCKFVGGLMAETRKPEIMTVSKSGEFVGIRNKRKLHIWKIPLKDFSFNEIKKIKLHHTKNLSTLAFHPTKRIVAGGDVTGRILVWKGFGKGKFSGKGQNTMKHHTEDEEERPGVRGDDDAELCSTWHWHADEVKFLSFSLDGEYLYSGGKEGVLVVWQIDTGKKKFLPRMRSPLLYFTHSPDPSLACISCADNQVQLVNMSSMKIVNSISGIKLPFSSPQVHGDIHGFAFDRASGVVALCSEAFSVQLYSLFYDAEISQVQVSERNYQPVDDVMVALALLSLSLDGSYMGTIEVKLPEEGIGGLICLKFWARSSQGRNYSLETVVYEPHSDSGISALAFHPRKHMAVSSSLGGDFKIWVSKSGGHKYQKFQKSGWSCQSVGSYKRRPMTAAAFSTDGTVLAVAADLAITLWDPNTNILITVIGIPSTEPIVNLSFTEDSKYLVVSSKGSNPQLAVWEMSTLSLCWSYKLSTEAVACSESGNHFAVLVPFTSSGNASALHNVDGLILLFNVELPNPIASWLVKNAKGGGLAFLHRDPALDDGESNEGNASSELLAFINGDHEFVVFDPFKNRMHRIRNRSNDSRINEHKSESFGYTAIYGDLPEFNPKEDSTPMISSISSERPWETIFCGPTHALAPLTKLCSTFLASLLEKNSNKTESLTLDHDYQAQPMMINE